jgi:hypothetical protein
MPANRKALPQPLPCTRTAAFVGIIARSTNKLCKALCDWRSRG